MRLKIERLNAGLTVEEMAQLAGVPASTYYNYERTGKMPRDPAVAKRIADRFGYAVTGLWPLEPAGDAA